jgi:hypothetical protein
MMRAAACFFSFAALLGAGCTVSSDLPASFVAGLRVLAGSGEPPQVAAGATSQLSLLVVDTGGLPVDVSWSRCDLPPLPGTAVNPDCVKSETATFLAPLGAGNPITVTMPQVTAADLGEPDASNGVYQPFVARVTDGSDTVIVVYRLRLGDGGPPNTNPVIASVDAFDAAGASTPLDPAAPRPVQAGEALTLGATFAPGSAETYVAIGGATRTETLTVSWFSTAGTLSLQKTSSTQPQTVLTLDKNLPNSGKNIDLFAVAHDERGGVGYTHRALELH